GALVRSAGLENGYCQGHLTLGYVFPACTDTPLTSNEVRQILAYTATRVHNNDAPTSNNYPPSNGVSFNDGPFYPAVNGDPHTGWNQWYGYGRPNLYDAVLYAAAKQIPPEAQLFGQTVPETAAFSGLSGPQWFGYYDPTRTPSLPIVGHVGDARHVGAGHTWSFKVQVAPCLEPADADWQTIATHAGLTVPSIDGVLATWTLPATPGQCADTSASRAFDYPGTYTVRVLASDDGVGGSAPNVTDPAGINAPAPLVGQDRRVLFVLHAASSHPGFPLSLGTSGEGSPTLYDLEGRGELDLIIPSADGEIIALRPDGTPVPGWPVFAAPLAVPGVTAVDGQAPRSQFVASVAVTDLNGDGRPDVVAALLKGGVYAWRNDGSLLPGFPVGVPPPSNGPPASASDYCGTTHAYGYATRYADYGTIAAPVLGDLEGTGRKDIVIAAGNGCVYALRPDGTPVPGWPVHPNAAAKEPYKIAATPALGSLSGDGRLDVIVGTEEVSGSVPNTNGYLYAYGPDGKLLPGWPVTPTSLSAAGVPTVASGIISSPALADPAGDGKLRLAGGVFLGGTDQQHPVNTYNPDGSTYSTLQTYLKGLGSNETDPSGAFGFGVTQTAVGRLGGATSLSVVSGGLSPLLVADTAAAPGKKPQFDHLVGAWDMTSGSAVATFPRMIEDWQFLSGPVIADVKGDGTRQVIAGSGGYWVHAFDPTVTADPTINSTTNNVSTTLQRYADYPEPAGFPVFTGGYITTTPAVGQLTRGGPVSLVTMTRDGFLVVTDTKGQPAANDQWWHFHHDERNTGRYGLDTRPPATVNDLAIAGVADPATSTDDSGRSLTWTAPGNDWWVGQADHYDLRWSTSPLTYASFASGTPIATAKPKAGGQTESLTLSGLPTGRVYFALRTFDAAGNASQTAFFVTGASQPPSTGPLPNTALGAGGPLLLALLLPLTALALWRRARVAGAP
ncbi:MAG TPA: hypothetical protein VG245_00055, partial [Candidatus Dormibacteraeota bacterium]|nr:hypothetical protein [Candidatus Dormibacteraeota bacterium]